MGLAAMLSLAVVGAPGPVPESTVAGDPGATSAPAGRVSVADNPWLVAASMRVAEAYWPANECNGRTVVLVMSTASLDALRGDTIARADGNADRCRIRVAREHVDGRIDLCTVLVHEVGHVHRVAHNNNPKSVMFAGGLERASHVCMRQFKPRRLTRLIGRGWRCAMVTDWWEWSCKNRGRSSTVPVR